MRVLAFFTVFLSLQAMAYEKFVTRIHAFTWSESPSEAHLIKFQNARVGFFYHTNKTAKVDPGDLVEVEITSENQLISMTPVDDEGEISVNTPFITDIEYVPSELGGFGEATDVMDRFRNDSKTGSECYDRAHIWTYEEFQRSKLYSMKAFLFFSDSYIRKYNYKWWFHVAPLVSYKTLGKKIDKVLDPKYANWPLSMKQWTNRFMQNNARCQQVERYSQYSRPVSVQDCYVIVANMYFWQPKDLEVFDLEGIPKVHFFDWEVNHAYQEAFGIVKTR